MEKMDSLGWATKSGDDVLVRELLGRQTSELRFNIETAACQAIALGRLDLFDLLVGDNQPMMEKLVVGHNHDKCGPSCFIPHILHRIPSNGHSDDTLNQLIAKAIPFNDRIAVGRWLEQLDTTSSNYLHYVQKIASKMIEHHWVDDFWALTKKHSMDCQGSGWAELVTQFDCAEIWQGLWGDGASQDNMRKALDTCCDHQSVNVLDLIWDRIEFGDDDRGLHAFLNSNCYKKHFKVTNWLLHKTNRSDTVTLLFMQYLLKFNRSKLASELFEQMSDQLRVQALDPNGEIFNLATPWREHFEELMDIQTHELDCQQRAHEQKLLSIQKFGIFSQWGATGNIDKMKLWLPWMDPKQQRQALMAAAAHGHLEAVQFLMAQGNPDHWSCPLLMAAKHGHIHILDFFLNGDVEQDIIDMAMNQATNGGQANVVQRLYPLVSTKCKQQVLTRALCFSEKIQTTIFLLEQGCTLMQDNLDWMMAIDWSAHLKNDQIIPQIAHLLPTHPYNAVIFERCVEQGMFQSAQSLLNKFDHNSFSFHHIFSKMCKKGDLRMVRFLAPHYDFGNRLNDTIGLAIEESHWAVVEDMLEHSHSSHLTEDLLWTVFTQTTAHPIAIHMAKSVMKHCSANGFDNKNVLYDVACMNIPKFVDLIYPFCTLDEIKYQIQWMMMDDEVCDRWETLYLTKRYEEDLLRAEMEQAVADLGREAPKRLM